MFTKRTDFFDIVYAAFRVSNAVEFGNDPDQKDLETLGINRKKTVRTRSPF